VCGNNFTTHESVEFGGTIAVLYPPRDLRPFSRDELFASVYESFKHRTKAVDDASAVTQTIIGTLRDHIVEGTLERDTIVTVTHAILERFDKAAATMYAAYHPPAKG
jgi:transcriptional regulator NrdR family protein